MESKKRDWSQISQSKSITRTCYNNRKESIKKKTMELATLCGINACAIICGPDGEFESWPENPTKAKAIIKNFKDLMNNPYKKIMVRDESKKKDVVVPGGSCSEIPRAAKGIIQKLEYLMNDSHQRTTIADDSQKEDFVVPDGETHTWPRKSSGSNQTTEETADSVDQMNTLSGSSLTEYQEFLMQLESKLEALNKRIVFLRKDQHYDTNSCSTEKKQLYYSEKTPLFPFDLNYPLAGEAKYCLSLSSEDYNEPRHC